MSHHPLHDCSSSIHNDEPSEVMGVTNQDYPDIVKSAMALLLVAGCWQLR